MIPERRGAPRHWPHEVRWLCFARLRPGHDVVLVNVSSGGALVEADARMLPGTSVMLQLYGASGHVPVSARVLRSQVAALHGPRGVRYRGALAFDAPLDLAGQPEAQPG